VLAPRGVAGETCIGEQLLPADRAHKRRELPVLIRGQPELAAFGLEHS
jgi:hypothetical protein